VKVVSQPDEMKNLSRTLQRSGASIGLVPTMGALHDGHLSLLKRAQKLCDTSVISIFVNPAQFGPGEDLAQYPRPFEKDCELAEKNGCDIVFAPQPADMYPSSYQTLVEVEALGGKLCGRSRPTHFRGVATVVLKLFNIVMPQAAVFGQKDAQQAIILKRMVRDLNLSVRMEIAPTVRESDGLAMSSRNAYLTERERFEVPHIYQGLQYAGELYDKGEHNVARLRTAVMDLYNAAQTFTVEYFEMVDTERLEPVEAIDATTLIAGAFCTESSHTRLIDNIIVGGAI